MTPAVVPYAGRAKWGEVVLDLVLAALGGLLARGAWSALGDVAFVRALAVYTAFAAAATLVLAVARVLTRRLPVLERGTPPDATGEDAWVLRAWPGDWWHAVALDVGLAALGGWLAVLGVRAGGELVVPGLAAGVAGAWFAVRVALAATGRRSRETLRLTGTAVVHDSAWGRVRCERADVRRVTDQRSRLVLRLDRPARTLPCPRPWRGRRRGTAETIVVDCSRSGHDVADLARWVAGTTGAVRTTG